MVAGESRAKYRAKCRKHCEFMLCTVGEQEEKPSMVGGEGHEYAGVVCSDMYVTRVISCS